MSRNKLLSLVIAGACIINATFWVIVHANCSVSKQ
jgi:hypothetical protein